MTSISIPSYKKLFMSSIYPHVTSLVYKKAENFSTVTYAPCGITRCTFPVNRSFWCVLPNSLNFAIVSSERRFLGFCSFFVLCFGLVLWFNELKSILPRTLGSSLIWFSFFNVNIIGADSFEPILLWGIICLYLYWWANIGSICLSCESSNTYSGASGSITPFSLAFWTMS